MANPDKTATAKSKAASPGKDKIQAKKSPAAEKPPAFKNLITWFEIPAHDFKRAVAFYNHLYDFALDISEVNGYKMALFPSQKGINGAIICGEGSIPSSKGPLLYLNAFHKLDEMLPRIEEAGGQILLGKTLINPTAGSFALFLDSEGNKLALHEK